MCVDERVRLHVDHRNPLKLSVTMNKQVWDILEGRNNLFYALLAFIRYHQLFSAGFLDTLYLGGSLGLLELLQEKGRS